MKVQQNTPNVLLHVAVFVSIIFFMIVAAIIISENAGAVTSVTGTNTSLMLFDDGDRDRSIVNVTPDLDVNTLFNDTSNVYFYANYTNETGQLISSSSCAIEFEAGAGGNSGPFSMTTNVSLGLFEYNKSFQRNGTFAWNVTCNNTAAGLATLNRTDSIRIFGPGCTTPVNGTSTLITNNTIFCGGNVTLDLGTGTSAINISNNNITLDCNGTIIRGNNLGIGLSLGPFNGTTINGCTFENYTDIVRSATNGRSDYFLLFNNSFANATTTGINISNIGNITLRNNTLTNISNSIGIFAVNITNMTLQRNTFCNLNTTITNISTNYTATNNSLCVSLINPLNNTDTVDINFTFTIPSIIGTQTCHLVTNSTNQSGAVVVPEAVNTQRNVTLNKTFFSGVDRFDWQVNCTDTNNNNGISALFNTTYSACSVPTTGATIRARNVTLCPGRYELNTTTTAALSINGVAGGILCNNTIIVGNNNNTAAAVRFFNAASDAQLRHCHIIGYATGADIDRSGPDRTIIHNNTFENISLRGILIRNISSMNITNNTFSNIGEGLHLLNTIGHSIDNNIIYNGTFGLLLDNATGLNIRNNNLSNLSEYGIQINVTTPLVNRTFFNYTIAGNYFCGIRLYALFLVDFEVTTDINGTVPANTFCGPTDANPNGGIGRVSWTVDVLTRTNTGPLLGSLVRATTRTPISHDTERFVNDSGIARLFIQQFNISADNTVTQRTPHKIIGNSSTDTKTIVITINKTRITSLAGGLTLNLSDPDIFTSGKKSATLFKPKMSGPMGPMKGPAKAAPASQSSGDSDDEEEEEVEVEVEEVKEISYTYGVSVTTIMQNNKKVYENNEVIDTITLKDYEPFTLSFLVKSTGTGTLHDLAYTLTIPENTIITSQTVDRTTIEPEESALVTFTLEPEDLEGELTLMFSIKGENVSIALDLSSLIILEEGKGELFYTRERIIEETKSILIRTYKILFLLFLIPILLLLRMTTITDEKAIRSLIEQKKLGEYWKVYVSESVYPKYNMFENVKPLALEEDEQKKATALAQKEKITYELATLVLFGNKKLIPRVFTLEEIPKELRHKYPRILFTSPLRNFKEDQLQRYVETQVAKGHTNNEIREVLLGAGWKKEIVKRFLNPEKDLDKYVIEQKEKGKSLGEIRKILLGAKWSKEIVDTHVPKDMVLKEYVNMQRKKGISNAALRKELLRVGWEKELVQKYLNPENDLKAYIVAQQQKGTPKQEIVTLLVQKGWKKEIVDKYVKINV